MSRLVKPGPMRRAIMVPWMIGSADAEIVVDAGAGLEAETAAGLDGGWGGWGMGDWVAGTGVDT